MKIFFFIRSLAAGGAETQSTIIASGLKSRGYDVEFIVYSKDKANSKNLKRLEDAGIPIRELFWKRPTDLLRMYKLFRANRYGAFLGFTSFPNFIGGCVAKLVGMKRIYAGIRSENLPRLHMVMERFCNLFIVTKTIFNSYRGRDNFIKLGFIPCKCVTISNAVCVVNNARMQIMAGKFVKERIRAQNVRIVTVGRFIKSKDYFSWLRVIAKVHAVYPDIEALIIGYGELETQIRDWVKEMNLSDVVTIKLGNGDIDIDKELIDSDIYFTTTLREGCCNTILEAMRSGSPVVATDVGDNARLITEGYNGFIAPPRDIESLSKKLSKLIADQKLRRQFGIRSRERIEKCYSVYNIVSEYKKIIERG